MTTTGQAKTDLPDCANETSPLVIIGAGLAGLYCALKLQPHPVTVISPTQLGEGASSAWAQGGIAAAVGVGDTVEDHAADTIAAGAGLVDPDIAMGVARDAAACVEDLLRLGVPFDRDLEGKFVQSREAAHSKPRVVRVTGDRAGKAIMEALIAEVRATPSIRVLEGLCVIDVKQTRDARFTLHMARTQPAPTRTAGNQDIAATAASLVLTGAAQIILATGGIGSVYRATTNPPTSIGTGLALAAKLGAVIRDAEFVQFHPTAIAVDADPTPLASEALRGEGALLVNGAGQRFMVGQHPDAELAPRDIVARAVFREIAAGRGAYLDCRTAIGAEFHHAFPTVYQMCRKHGIDPAVDLIPVAPAEHYHMGGVATDATARTTVGGLWAIGEVAATGLHGANRLASNSLLEAVVFARRAADELRGKLAAAASPLQPARLAAPKTPQALSAQPSPTIWSPLRALMSANVGVLRDGAGLEDALKSIDTWAENLKRDAPETRATLNLLAAARAITVAALRRRESRGAHARDDFPQSDPALAQPIPLERDAIWPAHFPVEPEHPFDRANAAVLTHTTANRAELSE